MGDASAPLIRRLTAADADDYRAVRLDSLRLDPTAFGTLLDEEQPRPLQYYSDMLTRADAVGAYVGGRIVGVARLFPGTVAKERHKGTINGVFVHPAHRGRGIGRALLATLIEGAHGRLEQITLGVVSTNAAAIGLYERLGFRRYGLEPCATKGEGGYSDELLMVLLIGPAADDRFDTQPPAGNGGT